MKAWSSKKVRPLISEIGVHPAQSTSSAPSNGSSGPSGSL